MGGVRTAIYNYLFAKKHGGDFIVRIEDTDRARYVPGAEDYIFKALEWCGITPDEAPGAGESPYGPYRQSERKAIYREHAERLVSSGHAYYAFDTPGELEAMRQRLQEEKASIQQYGPATRGQMTNSLTLSSDEVRRRLESGEPYVIRIRIPEEEEIVLQDIIRGEVRVDSSQLDDKVLFKSDGMPTYHLANVVDDHLMHISHVIRGEEWLPSTPLHVLLYRFFEWTPPQFAHLPLLLKPDGKGKLSKRDGDRLGFPVFPLTWKDPASGELSEGYREKGFLPEAFVNMLALLGWSPEDDREMFTLSDLASVFDLSRVHKAGSKYNYEKALWFNHQYLQQKSDAELAGLFRPLLRDKGIPDEEAQADKVEKVVELIKERCSLINELWDQGWFFFRRPESFDTGAARKKWDEGKKAFFDKVIQLFESDPDLWKGDEAARLIRDDRQSGTVLEERFKQLMNAEGLKPGEVMLPLRIMLVGGKSGPGVFTIAALLGKEETLARIRAGLNAIGDAV